MQITIDVPEDRNWDVLYNVLHRAEDEYLNNAMGDDGPADIEADAMAYAAGLIHMIASKIKLEQVTQLQIVGDGVFRYACDNADDRNCVLMVVNEQDNVVIVSYNSEVHIAVDKCPDHHAVPNTIYARFYYGEERNYGGLMSFGFWKDMDSLCAAIADQLYASDPGER